MPPNPRATTNSHASTKQRQQLSPSRWQQRRGIMILVLVLTVVLLAVPFLGLYRVGAQDRQMSALAFLQPLSHLSLLKGNGSNNGLSTFEESSTSEESLLVQAETTKTRNAPEKEISSLEEPWKIIEYYIAQHSQAAIEADNPNNHNRSYAVAFYSCPQQLGNRLHHFLNSFLWSILTDRTLLWKYWDKRTCKQFGNHYDSRICRSANHVQDCDAYLKRKSWMMSWDVDLADIKQLSFWSTYPPYVTPSRGYRPYNESLVIIENQLGLDLRRNQWPVVAFPQMLGLSTYLMEESTRNHLLHSQEARLKAQGLFQHGPDALYGLLFHAAFDISSSLLDNTNETVAPNPHFYSNRQDALHDTPSNCSIAVHSRHSHLEAMGDDVFEEVACIQQLWQQNANTTSGGCDLYIMTDRPHTLQNLVKWCVGIPKRPVDKNTTDNLIFPCQRAIYAVHERGMSFSAEHGPYAGVGFLQDLIIVSKSASSSLGVVGGKRSSTYLLTEWMEHERMLSVSDGSGSIQMKAAHKNPLNKCLL